MKPASGSNWRYVITNEIERQLEKFLDTLQQLRYGERVWISGFFGSGKSHLLKMLALLLENRDVGGSPPTSFSSEMRAQ